ncbi:MAG: NADP-dependent oxidoreductase [Actinophytocola sp.]|uniref:NADP-dependent oxidoreductase n=1 Tax=Actinophytocola sp. TaxID=1872138 RepID=UPI003C76D393
MRAISAQRAGGPEVLAEIELDRPAPGPVEILVRVHAAGVNPTDWKARARGGTLGSPGPFVPGYDVSGVVAAVGPGVRMYAPGDEVFGMPLFPKPPGAYADYVVAPPRHFARKPASLDHVTAAGLPLAGLTAWQSLVDCAGLLAGQRVLVHAAAGGVGHLAVQIAKARGAHVIGTASAAKHDFVLGLGADEVIDYTTTDFATATGDLDVVLDTIGGDYRARSLPLLRAGGTYLALTPGEDFLLVEPDHAGMLALVDLVENGRLTVAIDSVFPLADAAKAHERGETGRAQGKIVLRVV